MRIVGGVYKGRVLCPFEKIGVRPTSDKTRESLFNILQFKIKGASFLDLFSGTGAMGIEAYSRGASEVVLNDNSYDSVKLIKANLEKLKINSGIKVYNYDALSLIKSTSQKFDVVFIDPPYQSDVYYEVLNNISNILNSDGVVVVESENVLTENFNGLKISDNRKYGRAHLTFFKKDN